MNQRYTLIWCMLLVAGMICLAPVSYGGERDALKEWEEKAKEKGRKERLKKNEEEVPKLIVMIKGQLGDGPTMGAGIIFGRGKDHIYIATANHVVRRGKLNARDVQIKLKDLPDEFLPATLLDHADEDLDLAVLRLEGLGKHGIDGCTLPMDHLGDGGVLKRGDAVYPIGYPNGVSWGMPIVPDRVAQIAGKEITFQSSFISVGHSGGGLLNETYDLIGTIRKDSPPFGLAIQIESMLKALRQWGYPVQLYAFREDGMTPLHLAAKDGDFAGVKRLLDDECVNVDEESPSGGTALSQAVWSGNMELVKLLLEEGADPGVGDPMVGAAHRGQVAMVELLLAHGAKVISTKNRGPSPLQAATREGHIAIVRLLLDAGADAKGKGLLYRAVHSNNLEIAKLLLDAGADAKEKGLLHEAVNKDELEIVKLLIGRGADVNAKFGFSTVLYQAVSEGNVEIVKLLLDAGADAKEENLLHEAENMNKLEIAKLLVEHGADVNAGDNYGTTVLHQAVSKGNVETVKFLLAAGADAKRKGLLNYAVAFNKLEIARLLLAAGADAKQEFLLYDAVRNGKLEIVKLLLEHGADVNTVYAFQTVLFQAVVGKNVGIVKLLLNAGANPNINDGYRRTSLHAAVDFMALDTEEKSKRSIEIVRLLIQAGAEVNAIDDHNQTPLDIARNKEKSPTRDAVINLLQAHGGASGTDIVK